LTVGGLKLFTTSRDETPVNTAGAWTTGGQLQTQITGNATVATFEAFGKTWQVRDDLAVATLKQVGASSYGPPALLRDGGGVQIDVPGGTIFLEQMALIDKRVSIEVDGGGTAEGRWMTTFRDRFGHPGRLWVIPVPGSGHGVLQIGDSTHLRSLVSWPLHTVPQAGDIIMSANQITGANRIPLSWALRWSTPGCPVVQVLQPKDDAGTSSCLIPWDRTYPGVSQVGGYYGQSYAVVALVGPKGMNVDVAGSGGIGLGVPACIDTTAGTWTGSRICVVPVPVGKVRTVTVSDNSGHQLGAPFTLAPTPGHMQMSRS